MTASAQRDVKDRQTAQRLLEMLRRGADLRQRKVRHLRRAVESVYFENPLKLEIALDRLQRDLGE